MLWECLQVQGIRIEPDWNVKDKSVAVSLTSTKIRIEPDWNVKLRDSGNRIIKGTD